MIILFNVRLNDSQKVVCALTKLFGIGKTTAQELCAHLGLSETLKVKDLTSKHQDQLQQVIRQFYLIENEKRHQIRGGTERLTGISCWRGLRLSQGLPCRGQRTHGNGNTARRLNSHRVKTKTKN